MRAGVLLLLTLSAGLAGCSSNTPLLMPRSAEVPDGVDLSGQWVLAPDQSAALERLEAVTRRAPGDGRAILDPASDPPPSRRRGDASLLHLFLEAGSKLRLTQTDYALYVSFDRAVVEEYEFGEHGPARVGQVLAERSAGWEGAAFVIETADEAGARLLESWALTVDDRLRRTVRLTRPKQSPVYVEQVFARQQ